MEEHHLKLFIQESQPILTIIQQSPQLLEEEAKRQQDTSGKKSKETENEDIQEEVLAADFELSKSKLKDNLSDVCKRKTENIVKCQVKGDITVEGLRTKLRSDMEKRSVLQKFASECEMQTKYLETQISVEKQDRIQIKTEMETVGQILSLNSENIQSQETHLWKYKNKLLKYQNDGKDILNEVNLLKESDERIKSNKLLIEDARAEIESTQNEIVGNRNEYINQKLCLQRNLGDLQEQLVVSKKHHEELLKQKEAHSQKINKTKEESFKLEAELNSVDLDETSKMFENLKERSKARIDAKKRELHILNERLLVREEYLKEFTNKLAALENKKSNLIDRRNVIITENAQNRTVHEELVKKRYENQLRHKQDLDELKKNKEELEINLQEIESDVAVTIENVNQFKERLSTLQSQLLEESSTIISLEATKNVLENELEILTNTYQTRKDQLNSLKNETLLVEKEVERLTAEKVSLEEELHTLQTTASIEISELNNQLELIKNTEKNIEMNKIHFENSKVKDIEELANLKENNERTLNEHRNNLANLKNTQASLKDITEDLETKLLSKTESRDMLRNQYQQAEKDIQRLENDVKNLEENDKKNTANISELGSFQKPVGILKNSTLKSPQKKVTFDKSVNWDTLSESSTDAFFDNLLKKSRKPTEKNQKTIITSDNIFDMLRRNSPPEREVSDSKIQ